LGNGANPIGVIVPCHRVVGSDGGLTGYGGGLERKQFLLDLEKRRSAPELCSTVFGRPGRPAVMGASPHSPPVVEIPRSEENAGAARWRSAKSSWEARKREVAGS